MIKILDIFVLILFALFMAFLLRGVVLQTQRKDRLRQETKRRKNLKESKDIV